MHSVVCKSKSQSGCPDFAEKGESQAVGDRAESQSEEGPCPEADGRSALLDPRPVLLPLASTARTWAVSSESS